MINGRERDKAGVEEIRAKLGFCRSSHGGICMIYILAKMERETHETGRCG